jgi:hypothetical protein
MSMRAGPKGVSEYLQQVCEREAMRLLEATGFAETTTDEQLVSFFSKFGSCAEINVYEEYAAQDTQRREKPFLFCVAKMTKHGEALAVLDKQRDVYDSPQTCSILVTRHLPDRLRDPLNEFVPNGVMVDGLEGASDGLAPLEDYFRLMPGVNTNSVMLVEQEESISLKFIIYFESCEMAERVLLLNALNYPYGSSNHIKLRRLKRSRQTSAHPYAMQTPRTHKAATPAAAVGPAPVRGKLAAAASTCQSRMRNGFDDGYRQSMDKIQQIVEKYLSTNPSSVPDVGKMRDTVAKMMAKPTPNMPDSAKCPGCK